MQRRGKRSGTRDYDWREAELRSTYAERQSSRNFIARRDCRRNYRTDVRLLTSRQTCVRRLRVVLDSIAGTDTTSTSLSFLLYELSRREDIATKLRAEIDSAMVDPESIPENRVLRDLPYLNAVISEGMSCDLAWKASSYVWDIRRLAYI